MITIQGKLKVEVEIVQSNRAYLMFECGCAMCMFSVDNVRMCDVVPMCHTRAKGVRARPAGLLGTASLTLQAPQAPKFIDLYYNCVSSVYIHYLYITTLHITHSDCIGRERQWPYAVIIFLEPLSRSLFVKVLKKEEI